MTVNRDRIQATYAEGVAALESFVRFAGSEDVWDQPACGVWSVTETSRHVLSVANWYHGWLDRSIAGEASPPFPHTELDGRNAADLNATRDWSGPDALATFEEQAVEYHARAVEHWDRPFGYPFGVVTVGHHYSVAAAEWHLHAWDLLRSIGRDHQPSDPRALFAAAGACMAIAEGGIRGAFLTRAVPIVARVAPWKTMLRKSGRG